MVGTIEKAKVAAARDEIRSFKTALLAYKIDAGTFPTSEEGLEAVRPYLEMDVPNDPWGHPYVYRFPGEHGDAPDIISLGADGKPNGEGINADVVSWRN
jgi:general secretion pathway protein G